MSRPHDRMVAGGGATPGAVAEGSGRHLLRYRYPWREGNRFELLVDGGAFFPRMLADIEAARESVLLEIYLVESGQVAERFITALTAAAGRGVAVALLLDAFGASGLRRRERDRLRDAGVHLRDYNPLRYGELRRNLFRDHRKLLAVDSRVAFVGGAGLTDEFDASAKRPWHETMVRVEGPCCADWHALFLHNWRLWAGGDGELPPPRVHTVAGGRPGRITVNEPARMEIKRSLVKRVRGAERRVWMSTAYFIPSAKLRRALRRAARRGVDVRLLLPGPHTDNPPVRSAGRRYYGRLLRHGVRIFEYQPRFLHAKALLCDDWSSIGSSNGDRWNLRWNLEANQEADDAELAKALERMFERDFHQSREYAVEHWPRRPWLDRLAEWFWGKVERWLERRSQRRRGEP